MDVQTIVNDVKGRVEPYVAKGQEVVTVSVDTLKKANVVVADGVQALVKNQFDAGKDLIAAVQTSFDKAKTAGIKAVASSPIEYLPDGRERVISAYNDTVTLVSKTGGEVVKIVKAGFDSVSASFGATTAKPAAKKAPRKSARKSSAKKAA